MTIVITMAGLGSRFKKAGYKVPKYQIEVHQKTLFEWSMESLKDFRETETEYIFVVQEEPEKEKSAEEFIRNTCKNMGLTGKTEVISVDYLTSGQAETALLAEKCWNPNSELLIYNIDTYVEAGQMTRAQIKGDGFLPCFRADGEHWSFVRLNENGKAVEVREKERISDNCTIGAYYFRSCGLYGQLYREYYGTGENLERGERYVAPLYNHMISKGMDVEICVLDAKRVHVLGTPEELREFEREYHV